MYLVDKSGIARILKVSAEAVRKMRNRGELGEPYGLVNEQKEVWLQSDIEQKKTEL